MRMKKVVTSFLAAAIISFSPYAQSSLSLKVEAGNKFFTFSAPECVYLLKSGYLLGLEEKIDYIYKSTYVSAKDSEIIFQPDDKKIFIVTDEKNGAEIDAVRLKRDILDCLSVGGGAVKAAFHSIEPKIKRTDLVKYTVNRGRFTTYFNPQQVERSQNIALAAKLLNGVRIEKGEVFSFNDTVGPRTLERGFQSAKVIVDGEFTDGVGGGVCQVSTTLYNAALLAGAKIMEQHRHTLAVGYVEKSFDAMVSFGYADLKFKNVSDGPLFISAKVENNAVSIAVYGEKLDREIRRESVIVKVNEPIIKTIATANLEVGQERIVTYPKTGYVSEGYLIEIKDGVEKKILLRKDEYKAVDGVTEVGGLNEN